MARMIRTAVWAAALVLVGGALASADTRSGNIERVDATAKTFVLKVAKKVETFSLAPDAKVMRGGTAIGLADVKPSEHAKVEFKRDHGKRVASRLEIGSDSAQAPAAPHASAASKAAHK